MDDAHKLMVKIAKMYYEEGMTQTVISERLGISRPKVSRLMHEAMEQGIIRIEIASTVGDHSELMQNLQSGFDLLEAIVVHVNEPITYEAVSYALGVEAATYFQRIVKDGDVVGLTWGSALASMVTHLPLEKKPSCMVVQLVGGLGSPNTNTHATDLVSRTATTLGAKMSLLPAPGVVGSVDSANILLSDHHVNQALEWAKRTDVAFVGLGSTKYNPFLLQHKEIITLEELHKLQSQGAVGDISLHFFDGDGQEIESEFHRRVIGISYENLKKIPRVVAIAGGMDKHQAILGAVRGKLINTLITDQVTADYLLGEV
jgi:DNA-binding transcriptional regulator LsrR (DeoR family)